MIHLQFMQTGTTNYHTVSIPQANKGSISKKLTVINLKTTAKLESVRKFFNNLQSNLAAPGSNLASALQARIDQINQTKFAWWKTLLLFFAPYTKENLIEEKKAWEILAQDIQKISGEMLVESQNLDLSQLKLNSQIQFIPSDTTLNHNFSIYSETTNFLDGKSVKVITVPTQACLVAASKFFKNIKLGENQQKPLFSSLSERMVEIKKETTGFLKNFFLFFNPWAKWDLQEEKKAWKTLVKDLKEISQKCKVATSSLLKPLVPSTVKQPEITIPTPTLPTDNKNSSSSHNPVTPSKDPTATPTPIINSNPAPVPDSAGLGIAPPPPPEAPPEAPDLGGSLIPPPPDFGIPPPPPGLDSSRFGVFSPARPTVVTFFSDSSLLPNEPEPPKGFKALISDADVKKLNPDTLASQTAAISTYSALLGKYKDVLEKVITTYTTRENQLESQIKTGLETIDTKTKELDKWKKASEAIDALAKNKKKRSVEFELPGIGGGARSIEYFSAEAWEEMSDKFKRLGLPPLPEDYKITPELMGHIEANSKKVEAEIKAIRVENMKTTKEIAALQENKFIIATTAEDSAFSITPSENEGVSLQQLRAGLETIISRVRTCKTAVERRQTKRKNSAAMTPQNVVEGISAEEVAKLKTLSNNIIELNNRVKRKAASASADDDFDDEGDQDKGKGVKPKTLSPQLCLLDEIIGNGTIKR